MMLLKKLAKIWKKKKLGKREMSKVKSNRSSNVFVKHDVSNLSAEDKLDITNILMEYKISYEDYVKTFKVLKRKNTESEIETTDSKKSKIGE
jgi:hypothetical protein